MKDLGKDSVSRHRISEDAGGQRIDNYLLKILKGVPTSHVYRILRSGEVRVNSGRAKPAYRLRPGDELRLPPVRVAVRAPRAAPPPNAKLERAILYEDEDLLVLNKPSGLAVHGGSGVSFGVIEQLRSQRPLAKKRRALTALHAELRAGRIKKYYLTLVKGKWGNAKQSVRLNLHKYVLASGERRVAVDTEGAQSHTIFELQQAWRRFSLLRAELKTGRTHQIRVHLAHLGYPIAGDDKYGDFGLNKDLAHAGLKRMFLHASCVSFKHPGTAATLTLEAPLPDELQNFLQTLDPI